MFVKIKLWIFLKLTRRHVGKDLVGMWTWLNVLGFSLVPFSPEFNSGDPKVPCRFPC